MTPTPEKLKPLTHWMEKAAQLWCLPKHKKKEMDSDLAFSIAELCLDAYNEGRKATPPRPSEDSQEVEAALAAADACAARPSEKKRLGPMFGGHLEALAKAYRRLRESREAERDADKAFADAAEALHGWISPEAPEDATKRWSDALGRRREVRAALATPAPRKEKTL